MGKALKYLLIAVVILVLVVAGGAAAIVLLVDPNDYRDEIASQVREQTGRELTLGGDIGLSVFPWLGLTLNDARLSNAPGFGDEPFAEVGEVEIRVKLMPLLSKQLEMETARLIGLKVNLARNENGRTNWDDLTAGKPGDEGKGPGDRGPGAGGEALAGLAIGGIEIRDAALTWDDRLEDRRFAVQDLRLTTGPIDGRGPVDVAFGFDVRSDKPEMRGPIEFKGRVLADHVNHRMRVDGAELTVDLEGAGLPGGAFDASLRADLAADMAQQTASIANLRLDTLGVSATGGVEAAQIQDAPRVTGQLDVAEFELAELVGRLGIELPEGVDAARLGTVRLASRFNATQNSAELERLVIDVAGGQVEAKAKIADLSQPSAAGELELRGLNPRVLLAATGQAVETADPEVLKRLNLTTAFTGGPDRVALRDLALTLDESQLKGSASVRDFAAPAIRFELDLDTIDADRYLPPPAEGEKAAVATPGAGAGAAAQLPLDTLRALDIDGTLRIGRLKAYNLKSSDIVLRLTASDGQLRINPAQAQMYDGRYKGNIGLDVRTDTPQLSLDESLSGVQVGPLLRDLTGEEEKLTGRAQVNAKLTARGAAPEAIQKTLNGTAAFAFTDGAIKGVNLGKLIRTASATVRGEPAPSGDVPEETDFTELTGTAKITDGVIDNRDLQMKSPAFRVNGEGTASLPAQQVDYLVRAAIVGTSKGQGGQELANLKGVTVPVRIRGALADPKFSVDVAALATDQVKQRAREEIGKALQKQLGGASGDGTADGGTATGDGTTGDGTASDGGDRPEDVIKKGLKGLFGN